MASDCTGIKINKIAIATENISFLQFLNFIVFPPFNLDLSLWYSNKIKFSIGLHKLGVVICETLAKYILFL